MIAPYPHPLGSRFAFYPSQRVNGTTWPNLDDFVLINESVKMTFLVLLLGFILLILCKECGLCKKAWKRLSRHTPDSDPIVGNPRPEDPGTMVTVSDLQQTDGTENRTASGDFV